MSATFGVKCCQYSWISIDNNKCIAFSMGGFYFISMKPLIEIISGHYLLTACSTVLIEKQTGSPLVKKLPAFYGTRRFITAFTSARHLFLSWASSIQSITTHTTSWKSIIILPFHLRLGLPSGLFPSDFPHQNSEYAAPNPHTWYVPCSSHYSRFYHPKNIGWTAQLIKLLIL